MPLEKVKKFLEDIEENEIHFKEHFYDKTRERPISKELVKEYLKKTDWLLKVEEQSSGREGEKKEIQLLVYPGESFDQRGFYKFPLFIRSQDGSEIKQDLIMRIAELKDSFEVGSGDVNIDSSSIQIYIYNKEKFNFGSMSARFESPFFDFEKHIFLNMIIWLQ